MKFRARLRVDLSKVRGRKKRIERTYHLWFKLRSWTVLVRGRKNALRRRSKKEAHCQHTQHYSSEPGHTLILEITAQTTGVSCYLQQHQHSYSCGPHRMVDVVQLASTTACAHATGEAKPHWFMRVSIKKLNFVRFGFSTGTCMARYTLGSVGQFFPMVRG